MEDLRNLMACIDEIANQIPDGMYLKMADQMKRVHDHMNGNKSIHDDTFYYSDDDSNLTVMMTRTVTSPRISIEHVSLILHFSETSFWIM